MKGLVVDPSLTQQRILSHVLRRVGCTELETAGDVKQGLALLLSDGAPRFDVVVVERDLPDGSGLDVVRKLREGVAARGDEAGHAADMADAVGETVAVLVTVRNARRDVLEALQAGVDAYVLKPLNPEALVERLEAAFGARLGEAA